MIFSMTAFARCDKKYKWGNISWEIRSLNQRYLDIYIDIPKYLHGLFWDVRERIKNVIIRGKIECYLNIEIFDTMISEFHINEELVCHLIDSAKQIKIKAQAGEINPLLILSWPGVVTYKQNNNVNDIHMFVLQCLDETLCCLIQNRKKEGFFLKERIAEKLSCIQMELDKIRRCIPNVLDLKRKTILEQAKSMDVCIDGNLKLEQALLIMIQKLDIAEEMDRLDSHIQAAYNILSMIGPIGRQLDFISQELYREVNTISAKSVNCNITQFSISVKVFVEQIREQAQNIE